IVAVVADEVGARVGSGGQLDGADSVVIAVELRAVGGLNRGEQITVRRNRVRAVVHRGEQIVDVVAEAEVLVDQHLYERGECDDGSPFIAGDAAVDRSLLVEGEAFRTRQERQALRRLRGGRT